MDRVLLDTTVLCGAIISPGVNYKIIQLARSAEFFKPIISEVVVCEFIEHCRKGLKKITYSEEEIDAFFTAVKPVLDFDNIKRIGIGKELWVDMCKSHPMQSNGRSANIPANYASCSLTFPLCLGAYT
ncbi:hypothetical protein JCM15765_24630 [Paradesulfitobacterium aromaticivorans]